MDVKKQILKNIINLFLVGIVSVALSASNRIGVYILYLTPIVFIPTIFLNFLDYKINRNNSFCCDHNCRFILKSIYMGITSLVCFPFFLGFFYGVFHPLQSYRYEEVNNCKIIGSAPINQSQFENYNLLYVDFEYEKGQMFLGQACISDLAEQDYQYSYIYEDDLISCDTVGKSFDTPQNKQLRILKSIQSQTNFSKQPKRQLRVRGQCSKRGKFLSSKYNFSKVKLPGWLCMLQGITYEEYTSFNKCYVHFIDGKHESYQNAKDRVDPKSVFKFAIVVFDLPTFFPKSGLICLIVFCLIPFLINFYTISETITNGIYKILQLQHKIYDNID